jgi:hypothetical protein
MKIFILSILLLFAATAAFGQQGEVNITWDENTALCDGSPASTIEHYVHRSLSPQDPLTRPPAGYEYMVLSDTPISHKLDLLDDCTTYYVAVSAKNGSTWSGCGGIGGYSTEIVVVARPRLTLSDITQLERGKSYTLTITGANFQDGIFTDSTVEITYSTPLVIDCNSITVTADVPIDATLGSVDVRFERDFDNVLSIDSVGLLEVIANQDAPPAPTNVRRTQRP